VLREVTAILNKLAPERFETLSKKLLGEDLSLASSPSLLKGALKSVFEKAISETTFVSMYAQLCAFLAVSLPQCDETDEGTATV
jgi:translation initiation factor 4G